MTVLAEYDEAWPGQFAEMAELLWAAFGDTVTELEHIGSTAVPGLVAKPVIDTASRAADLEVAAGKDSGLAVLGFHHEPAGLSGFAYTAAKTDLLQQLTDEARRHRGLPPVPIWE